MTESWIDRTPFAEEVRTLLVSDLRDLAEYMLLNAHMPLNDDAIDRILFMLENAADCIEAIDRYSKCNRKSEL